MRKLLLSIFIVNLFFSFGISQAGDTATISGRVNDANDRPLSKVTVSIGNKSDFTDMDGRYRIRNVPAGRHKMRVRKGNKVLKEEDIEVTGTSVRKDLSIR